MPCDLPPLLCGPGSCCTQTMAFSWLIGGLSIILADYIHLMINSQTGFAKTKATASSQARAGEGRPHLSSK